MDFIAKYEKRRQLGEGPSGILFEAHDVALDRDVVLKILRKGFELDPLVKQRIIKYGWVGPELSNPNIAEVYDFGENETAQYVVTELLTGVDLKLALDNKLQLSLLQKLDLMARICDGMAHAHRHKILHLNLKPTNIFIEQGHYPKILDFGVRCTAETRQRSERTVPFLKYAAPEQILGHSGDSRCDLFSMGVVFSEFLLNNTSDETSPRAADGPCGLSPRERIVSEPLQDLLRQATAPKPDDRIQTAEEFAGRIRALALQVCPTHLSEGATAARSSMALPNTASQNSRESRTGAGVSPSTTFSQPVSTLGSFPDFGYKRFSKLLSPRAKTLIGMLLTAAVLIFLILMTSEIVRPREKRPVAQATIEVRNSPLFEAPNENSRRLRTFRYGTTVTALERVSSETRAFVHVRFVSRPGVSISGYLQTKDVGSWTSNDPDTVWSFLEASQPKEDSPPDEIKRFIAELDRFGESFPHSRQMSVVNREKLLFEAALQRQSRIALPEDKQPSASVGLQDSLPVVQVSTSSQMRSDAKKLLDRVPALWENGDLEGIVTITTQVLVLTPESEQAKKWRAKASNAIRELGSQ